MIWSDADGMIRRCRRWLRAADAALACVLVATGRAGAREFRAADIQEENYPTVQALRFMDQLVTQRTDKRHSIRVFHSRQLGEESQTIEQTRVGAIDINRINVGAIGNVAPVLNVLALPFLFRSVDHLYKVDRRPDRRGDPRRARAVRLRRADVLRFRRALDLHRAPAGAHRSTICAASASASSNPT